MRIDRLSGNIDNILLGTEVQRDYWRASRGSVLVTRGVLSSIVAAVHNPHEGIGYLGHFPYQADMSQAQRLLNFAETIAAHQAAEGYNAWIGGTPNTTAVDVLGRIGLKTLHQDWLKPGEKMDTVLFDTSTGHLGYSVSSVQE